MSIRVMSMIWSIESLSPVEKLALLALADWANDDGHAWPSINQIAKKTGCGHRTIQRAFRNAEETGLLSREEAIGKGCKYTFTHATVAPLSHRHPRHTDTPPPPHRHPTPATVAPNTPLNTNIPLEDKSSKVERVRASAFTFPLPDGVDPIDWDGLKQNRKAKRAALTEGAHRQIIRKLENWKRDGWPPGPIVAFAVERGWTTVFATDEMKYGAASRTSTQTKRGPSPDGFMSALREVADRKPDVSGFEPAGSFSVARLGAC